MGNYRIVRTSSDYLKFEVQVRWLFLFWIMDDWFETIKEAEDYVKFMESCN